ncbi:MAG: type VI secretion system tip protein TssI/VgrG [Polyangiaceae bacterium]
MPHVSLAVADKTFACRAFEGKERLGESLDVQVEIVCPEPVERRAWLGKPCAVLLQAGVAERAIAGVVWSVTSVATSQEPEARVYRVRVQSVLAVMGLRRRSRIFQHLTVPDIVRQLAEEGGYDPSAIRVEVAGTHETRDYVVQYDETDAVFVRRLCEDEGLFFREELKDGAAAFVLGDTSTAAAADLTIRHMDASTMVSSARCLWECRSRRRRRPGKVTLRDYDFEHPAASLEGVAAAGSDVEQGIEVYAAPGRFRSPDEGNDRAKLRLEALRAEALTYGFRTNAVDLAPGIAFALDTTSAPQESAHPEGDLLTIGVRHAWKQGDPLTVVAEAIPLDVPYRLPLSTPRPRIAGVQSAVVSGASGKEIDTDSHGRVTLKFRWDRLGPDDDKSSLRVRVVHPNMPGAMLLPRVGWETVTAFEEGDPERPFVLGRAFNAKQPPPVGLPANKTMTSLSTQSSPGAGKMNAIRYDDAAGRQHLSITAGFGKTATVANNAFTQTAKNETHQVGGAQTRTIGGKEDITVREAYLAAVGSSSLSVGATHKVFVTGHLGVNTGSESVTVGGAVLEKVGNPAKGALQLGLAAGLQGVGSLGGWGQVASMAGGLVKSGVEGYMAGGTSGAAKAVGMGVLGLGAGMLPAGDAIMASVTGAAEPPPWGEDPPPAGSAESGGGTSGSSDAAGAKGPGPGYRNTNVRGKMSEMIGGLHSSMTPGGMNWNTTGASTFLIGGSHSTKARKASIKVAGAASETLGSLLIKTKGNIVREVKGVLTTKVGGAVKIKSGAAYKLKAGVSLNINLGGSLKLDGSRVTFICGGAVVEATSSGVVIKAPTIVVNGKTVQAGKAGLA